MSQPTPILHSIRTMSGPMTAALDLANAFPDLRVTTVEVSSYWGVTLNLHDDDAADYGQWVAALGLAETAPREVPGDGGSFTYLHASGLFEEVPVQVRAYGAVRREPLPVRSRNSRVEVGLMDSWIKDHGEPADWAPDARLAYANTVANMRAMGAL